MKKGLVFCAILGLSAHAVAQTSTTTLSAPSVEASGATTGTSTTSVNSVIGNKQFEEDKNITDASLKANGGSLSRYSLKFNLSFSGPPVGDLSNKMQPNPDGSIGTYETAIGGSISARYRLDSISAVNLGTGVSALTPVQGVKRYDVKNPFVSYDISQRVFDTQMRHIFGATLVTNPDWRAAGETSGVSYDNYLVHNIGTTKFAAELDTSFAYYFYERGPQTTRESNSGLYTLAFYPQMKYNFTDRFNAYSSLAIAFINPRGMDNNRTALWNRTLSQRIGCGYAFTRDIYFAPYLNFYPKSAEMDSTTINFSTTFSIL
ncbi:MAG TPA: hypothetical protein VF412_14415 [Bdellovibrio sp.]|uniref:hypothetical protein n=1 Tax=Bdellovibrio sp. TaxID=28201 RepID=UPI002F1B23E2